MFTYGAIFSHPPTANTNIDKVVKYAKSNLGTNDLTVISGVATWPVIAGAANPNTIYSNDIINIDIPAILPITFNTFTPLVDIYKNTKNTAKTIDCNIKGFKAFKTSANSPDGLIAQESAINKACGFWAK